MIVRKLWIGAVMLCVGAMFTWGLASVMQQRATADVSSYEPSSSLAQGKRADSHWMF